MRAFKSLRLRRSLRVVFAVAVISTFPVSSLPGTAIARTRPPVDMGDPDPTEGTNPPPGGGAKARTLVRINREIDPPGPALRSQLREYFLVWRWIVWR